MEKEGGGPRFGSECCPFSSVSLSVLSCPTACLKKCHAMSHDAYEEACPVCKGKQSASQKWNAKHGLTVCLPYVFGDTVYA